MSNESIIKMLRSIGIDGKEAILCFKLLPGRLFFLDSDRNNYCWSEVIHRHEGRVYIFLKNKTSIPGIATRSY